MADQAGDRRADRAMPRSAGPDSAGARRLGPLLGLASAVGLAVAALCLHATASAPRSGAGPLVTYWVLLALAAGVGGCTLAVKYRVRQEERPRISPREERVTKLTVFGVFAICAATVISLIVIGSGRPTGTDPPATPPPTAPPLPSAPPVQIPVTVKGHPSHPFDLLPYLLSLLALLLAGILALVVYLVLRYLPRLRVSPSGIVSTPPPAEADETRLAEAVSAGRLALSGDDSRAAVIACYAAMEESLAANGLGRQLSDSPADLLDRAAGAGLLTGRAPAVLADLFREARFSSHPMGPEHLQRARAALDEIGGALREHQARAEAAADAWLAAEDEPSRQSEQDKQQDKQREAVTR